MDKTRFWAQYTAGMIFAAACIAVIGGCASTKFMDLWRDPTYRGQPLRHILVVAMQRDPLLRRIWEDAFANEFSLRDTAVVGVSSYTLFAGGFPDTTALKGIARENNFDGVLVISQISSGETATYVPQNVEPPEIYPGYSYPWDAYWVRYQDMYYPGYFEYESAVRLRAELLVVKAGGQLVWAAMSETVSPSSGQQLRDYVADKVIAELKKSNFII